MASADHNHNPGHAELLDLIEQAIPTHLQTPAMGYFAAECLHRANRRTRRTRT